MQLTIKYIPTNEINPYENNPRKNDEAVKYVAESIKEFGFKNPVILSKDNVVIAGHTRLKAAKVLGIKEIPCIYADDLSDDQIKAFRLADNKVAEIALWDFDKLEEELADINIDMSEFGFDVKMQDDQTEIIEDDAPEQAEPRCRLGDLWQLGDHRLICGDSTDVAVVDRLMDGVKADMVFTDPSYGMGLDSDFSSMHSKMNQDFANHEMKGTNYQIRKVDDFSAEMIDAIYSVNAPETFMWGADYYAELIPNRNDGSWIVWDKRTNESDTLEEDDVALDRGYGSCFELCYSKKKHKRNIARVKWSGLFGMEHEFDRKRVHPTQKPTRLAVWFLQRYSKDGDTVIDIFGGSGSTLIACEQLNRKCYMAELDPKYCDVIIERWENFTGEKAIKL